MKKNIISLKLVLFINLRYIYRYSYIYNLFLSNIIFKQIDRKKKIQLIEFADNIRHWLIQQRINNNNNNNFSPFFFLKNIIISPFDCKRIIHMRENENIVIIYKTSAFLKATPIAIMSYMMMTQRKTPKNEYI